MKHKPVFDLEQIVYLKTDTDQYPRMVTGLLIRPDGIRYYLSRGTGETTHFACEISTEKDELLPLKH